jgi:hypothetical protein
MYNYPKKLVRANGICSDFDNNFIFSDSFKPYQNDSFFSELSDISQVSANKVLETNFFYDINVKSGMLI